MCVFFGGLPQKDEEYYVEQEKCADPDLITDLSFLKTLKNIDSIDVTMTMHTAYFNTGLK